MKFGVIKMSKKKSKAQSRKKKNITQIKEQEIQKTKKKTTAKTTTKPEITISPTNFDLTGKYLICGISNTGNQEVFTSAIALNITDTQAAIISDLPSSVRITVG